MSKYILGEAPKKDLESNKRERYTMYAEVKLDSMIAIVDAIGETIDCAITKSLKILNPKCLSELVEQLKKTIKFAEINDKLGAKIFRLNSEKIAKFLKNH